MTKHTKIFIDSIDKILFDLKRSLPPSPTANGLIKNRFTCLDLICSRFSKQKETERSKAVISD